MSSVRVVTFLINTNDFIPHVAISQVLLQDLKRTTSTGIQASSVKISERWLTRGVPRLICEVE